MSSESSTSSIRQFGLYRTIDARTEEFLRLSRKRQLRQGCICAAISTAITVIVVIIIILIYEYSNVSSTNTIKSNWLGIINETIDTLPFDATQPNKAKMSFDRTTIQLLPILLKAFTRNKYYDQDKDDNSTPNPIHDERGTTEEIHKNIFSDTRNWMKMPTSRVYAIEFKTSPIVYFKNPTRNLDYFRKIRKIRDYERVMNYVDKMISEKFTPKSTQPMLKTDINIYEKPYLQKTTTPMTKFEARKTYPGKTDTEKHIYCNCCAKVSLLLQKLITSVQKIIPEFVNNKVETTQNCKSDQINPVTESSYNNILPRLSKNTYLPKPRLVNFTQSPSVKHKNRIVNKQSNDDFYRINETTVALNTILRSLKPNIENYKSKSRKTLEIKENLSNIADNSIEFKSVQPNFTSEYPKKYETTSKYYPQKDNNMYSTATMIENEYFDYAETSTNIGNIFNFLDTHSLELIKNNIITSKSDRNINNNERTVKPRLNKEPQIISFNYNTENLGSVKNDSRRNVINKVDELDIDSTENYSKPFLKNDTIVILNLNKTVSPSDTTFYSVEEYIKSYQSEANATNNDNSLNDRSRVEQEIDNIKQDNDKLEEEIEKSISEESEEDDNTKNMEIILHKSGSTAHKSRQRTTNSSELYKWELIKIEEHAKNISRLIMSQNRPTYLEMQKNDWKHDDSNNNFEYDANINNYIFD